MIVAFAASRAAVLDFNWLVDSRRIWGSTTPRSTSCVEPLDLRVPAVDLGLVLGQDRLGLGEARLGRLDVGLGHLHQLLGQLDPFLDRARPSPSSSRNPRPARARRAWRARLPSSPCRRCPRSTSRYSRSAWDRSTCARKLSMKLGCPTTRTMFRTDGWISLTVGGSETLVYVGLGLVAAARRDRAARSQNTSRRQPGDDPEPWA